eukprot:361851-Chlamydomonas_euryale.AAC.5
MEMLASQAKEREGLCMRYSRRQFVWHAQSSVEMFERFAQAKHHSLDPATPPAARAPPTPLYSPSAHAAPRSETMPSLLRGGSGPQACIHAA